jgi:hypothetical protein
MYELGIETEAGTNDGNVDGTTDQIDFYVGKTVMVPWVLMKSFDEIS